MRYKLLGRSGLRVSEISLGALTFGEGWGNGAPKDVSRRIFDTYLDRGGNFIDTANKYIDGTSEEYVGEFIAHQRERLPCSASSVLRIDSSPRRTRARTVSTGTSMRLAMSRGGRPSKKRRSRVVR